MKKILNWICNIPKDKILHFSVSALLTGAIGGVLTHFTDAKTAIAIGAMSAFGLGIIKEVVYDQFIADGWHDLKDVAADFLGAATGLGISIIPFV